MGRGKGFGLGHGFAGLDNAAGDAARTLRADYSMETGLGPMKIGLFAESVADLLPPSSNMALATNHRSEEGPIVLTIMIETLEAHPQGVLFQCDCGGGKIEGGITDTALRDLVDFHRLRSTVADASRVLLPELERIVNAKCDARKFEEDGEIIIRSVDLLRYGFQRRKQRAA